ncbi:MAG: cell division protein FtsZ [Verrucomicrobia bacterium]|nr:cell division protein FtsZ [Verrucomicrobiota bacterium]
MIPYERTRQQTIPNSSVKIIGVGGAGANMLDRVAIDGMDGAELLVANTDLRTLTSSVSAEKIQLGRALTKGLGSGGDPDLGRQAALEAELEIRDTLRDRKIVFICVGLGGGTGSGAAPLIARLAREEGAFTVVFATMPFGFEGKRRREQAGTALNELAVLANALVTFDNGRMGDLVLAKQGVHEAFAAADRMISEAIKAVTRIVLRPGLVNIGLDDLVAALSSNRSRCLFGSGIAEGENRAQQALKNALLSPLLDRGSLLAQAQTVLVHICGGEDLTLYEIELLMRGLGKHVPESAQMLFGTAVDPAMKDSLSVTLVSSLPEEALQEGISAESAGGPSSRAKTPISVEDLDEDFVGLDTVGKSEGEEPRTQLPPPAKIKGKSGIEKITIAVPPRKMERTPPPEPEPEPVVEAEPYEVEAEAPFAEKLPEVEELQEVEEPVAEVLEEAAPEVVEAAASEEEEESPAFEERGATRSGESPMERGVSDVTRRVKLPPKRQSRSVTKLDDVFSSTGEDEAPEPEPVVEEMDEWGDEAQVMPVGGGSRAALDVTDPDPEADGDVVAFSTVEPSEDSGDRFRSSIEELQAAAEHDPKPQGELLLEGGPKGRFEGEDPNIVGGEDLDIPPFLRKKKR